MALIGTVLVWGGCLLMLLGWIAFIVVAFRESILWGLGVLFLPFVSLIFLVLNWSRAKDSFFLQLWGLAILLVGAFALSARLPWQGT
jgi:hypothetical protein